MRVLILPSNCAWNFRPAHSSYLLVDPVSCLGLPLSIPLKAGLPASDLHWSTTAHCVRLARNFLRLRIWLNKQCRDCTQSSGLRQRYNLALERSRLGERAVLQEHCLELKEYMTTPQCPTQELVRPSKPLREQRRAKIVPSPPGSNCSG